MENTNTRYCKTCNHELKKEQAYFCSSSCSAKFNNKGVRRHGKDHTKECPNCKTLTKNPKYCNTKCQIEYERKLKILSGNFTSKVAKKYLLMENGHQCEICLNKEWMGKKITIELDHIDGNSSNNNLNNLRLICPNCHSQTPTYKAKNIGNGKLERKKTYLRHKMILSIE